MNKTELIDEIAEQAEVPKIVAARVLDAVIATVTTALRNGESVTLTGFGTFCVSSRAEHTGRNPRTGEEITIAAANVPKFKAGKSLKDAIN
ncbi:MAG: HU family DNA-binding protein [Azoarcus sp.]|jgi:DNA-binding protein HU-beta|nr:HU family DNA-binding protein [Azoarcus sp.]